MHVTAKNTTKPFTHIYSLNHNCSEMKSGSVKTLDRFLK